MMMAARVTSLLFLVGALALAGAVGRPDARHLAERDAGYAPSRDRADSTTSGAKR